MKKPPTSIIATKRSCGSFFFSSSKTNMLFFIPAALDFAVGAETVFAARLVTEGAVAPGKKGKHDGGGRRAPGRLDDPLPERPPADERLFAAVQQEDPHEDRHEGAGGGAEDKLRERQAAQDQIVPQMDGKTDQHQRQDAHAEGIRGK